MALLAQTLMVEQIPVRRPVIPVFLLLLLMATPLRADGSSVTVPIELDYPLLRQVLIKQLFNQPGESTEIVNDPSGCSEIVLANPQLTAKQPYLQIIVDVKARLGVDIFGGCKNLGQWQGRAGFIGLPIIQPGATSVRIELQDSWLVAADGRTITSGKIWELVKDRFHPLFNRFTLDLAPSIDAVGTILPEVLPHRSRQQLEIIVASLRLGDITVSQSSLDVSLNLTVEDLEAPSQSEAPLSAQELQEWETRWQMMDALFTFAVKYYASATSLEELHGALLEILIDSRYRLREALAAPISRSNDPVRRWFLENWTRLRPIIRRIGLQQTGQEPLLWISLLTATDALDTLDRLGPSIGLDISADGLRRLARLINARAGVDILRYDQAVDPELQRLLRLPSVPGPKQPSGFRFAPWPVRSAWAGTSSERLRRWAPNKDQLGEYLPLVARLLDESAKEALKKNKPSPKVARLFRKLVLATAWQESCWRQYVVSKQKIEPLRSSTGDVGLMQINERVWRGFYDIQKLRWDIAYNSRTGAEVLLNYLIKYALKQGEHKQPGGLDNLARASYSAYNGGPSQVSRYRRPGVASAHKKVDAAFWKKYRQVKAGNELNVAHCLGGEVPGAQNRRPPTAAVEKAVNGNKKRAAAGTPTGSSRERWLLAQPDDHFTLQLAVFSKQKSARDFIAQQSLSGQAHIHRVRKGQTAQFAVFYGSYRTRADADHAKQRLKHLKPWVRQFLAIRKAERS